MHQRKQRRLCEKTNYEREINIQEYNRLATQKHDT